jgi:hypothetical protein
MSTDDFIKELDEAVNTFEANIERLKKIKELALKHKQDIEDINEVEAI